MAKEAQVSLTPEQQAEELKKVTQTPPEGARVDPRSITLTEHDTRNSGPDVIKMIMDTYKVSEAEAQEILSRSRETHGIKEGEEDAPLPAGIVENESGTFTATYEEGGYVKEVRTKTREEAEAWMEGKKAATKKRAEAQAAGQAAAPGQEEMDLGAMAQKVKKKPVPAKTKQVKMTVRDEDDPQIEIPFGRGGIATGRNGVIVVNKRAYLKWYRRMPERLRDAAVDRLVDEETIHAYTSDMDALEYFSHMTTAEKMLVSRVYVGPHGGWQKRGITALDIGHEAIRQRIQSLSDMSIREAYDSGMWERGLSRFYNALNNAIAHIRAKFGTSASKRQLRILDTVQRNMTEMSRLPTPEGEQGTGEQVPPATTARPEQLTRGLQAAMDRIAKGQRGPRAMNKFTSNDLESLHQANRLMDELKKVEFYMKAQTTIPEDLIERVFTDVADDVTLDDFWGMAEGDFSESERGVMSAFFRGVEVLKKVSHILQDKDIHQFGEAMTTGEGGGVPGKPRIGPGLGPQAISKDYRPGESHETDLELARQLPTMTTAQMRQMGEEGFNRYNLRLFRNATPEQLSELQLNQAEFMERLQDAGKKYAADPSEANMDEWATLGVMSQFYSEGFREAQLHKAGQALGATQNEYPKEITGKNGTVIGPGPFAIIKAYHGSASEFEKFETEFIHTGQGATTYGWGLYFAEEPEVARTYGQSSQRQLAHPMLNVDNHLVMRPPGAERADAEGAIAWMAKEYVADEGYDGAVEHAEEQLRLATAPGPPGFPESERVITEGYQKRLLDEILKLKGQKIQPVFKFGYDYHVELDLEPHEVLDLDDRPTTEQMRRINNAMRKSKLQRFSFEPDSNHDLISLLEDRIGTQSGAADLLWRSGFRAFKYADQFSRELRKIYEVSNLGQEDTGKFYVNEYRSDFSQGRAVTALLPRNEAIAEMRKLEAIDKTKGTHNYVVFDEGRIHLLNRNGERINPSKIDPPEQYNLPLARDKRNKNANQPEFFLTATPLVGQQQKPERPTAAESGALPKVEGEEKLGKMAKQTRAELEGRLPALAAGSGEIITPADVDAITLHYLNNSPIDEGYRPSFDEFAKWARRRIRFPRNALIDVWENAVWRHLENAPGEMLMQWVKALDLENKLGKPPKGVETAPVRNIASVFDEAQEAEQAQSKLRDEAFAKIRRLEDKANKLEQEAETLRLRRPKPDPGEFILTETQKEGGSEKIWNAEAEGKIAQAKKIRSEVRDTQKMLREGVTLKPKKSVLPAAETPALEGLGDKAAKIALLRDQARVIKEKADKLPGDDPTIKAQYTKYEALLAEADLLEDPEAMGVERAKSVKGRSEQEERAEAAKRYRAKAISTMAQKLIQESVPDADLHPKEIFLEDIDFRADVSELPYHLFSAQDMRSPRTIQSVFREGARKSGKNVSVTKRLAVLLDEKNGKVFMVSAYPEGHSGIRVMDPYGSEHILLKDYLERYKPIASILVKDPVKDFKHIYKDMAEYNAKLGEEAQGRMGHEAYQEFAGERALMEQVPEVPPEIEGTEGVESSAAGAGPGGKEMRALMGEGRGSLERTFREPITAGEIGSTYDYLLDEMAGDITEENFRKAIDDLKFRGRELQRRGARTTRKGTLTGEALYQQTVPGRPLIGTHRNLISAVVKIAQRIAHEYRKAETPISKDESYDAAFSEIYNHLTQGEFLPGEQGREHFTQALLGKYGERISPASAVQRARRRLEGRLLPPQAESGARELELGGPPKRGPLKPSDIQKYKPKPLSSSNVPRAIPEPIPNNPDKLTAENAEFVAKEAAKRFWFDENPRKPTGPYQPTVPRVTPDDPGEEAIRVFSFRPKEVPDNTTAPQAILKSVTPKQDDLLRNFYAAANQVADRKQYGQREQTAPTHGYVLVWSSSGNKWYAQRARYKKGEQLRLDANQVFTRAANYGDAELIAKHLPEHPLARFSFERTPFASDKPMTHTEFINALRDYFKQEPGSPDVVDATQRFMDAIRSPEQDVGPEPGSPQAIMKGKLDRATEAYGIGIDSIKAFFLRRETDDIITAWRDRADTKAVIRGREWGNAVRSHTSDEMSLAAAKVVIASGGDHKVARSFLVRITNGEAKARELLKSDSVVKQAVARQWLEAADQLRKEVNHFLSNPKDEGMWNAAKETGNAFREQYKFEISNGIDLKWLPDYMPGRYEGDIFNDRAVFFWENRILGRNFTKPKMFPSYYHAIEAGPYIPRSYNIAELVDSRVRQGAQRVNLDIYLQSLKNVMDPATGEIDPKTGKPDPNTQAPVAMSGVREQVAHKAIPELNKPETITLGRYISPGPEYIPLSLGPNHVPIYIRRGFYPLVEALTLRQGRLSKSPQGRAALQLTGALKHGAILIIDTFHPARLGQYYAAATGFDTKAWGAWTALDFRDQDLDRAVKAGMISAKQAQWSREQVNIKLPNGIDAKFTRKQVLDMLIDHGLNVGRIQDALYRNWVDKLDVKVNGKKYGISAMNRLVFDKVTRGLMASTAVESFERYNNEHPEMSMNKLMRDVVKDTNLYYGSLGRQGFFKDPTFQEISQLLFLAPQWVEGLIQKESRFISRTVRGGLNIASGGRIPTGREGLPAMGTLGRGVGRGLVGYLAITQMINLATRGQLTFQNKEEGHKLDAWIPTPWNGKGTGFWLSALSVFAEVLHDYKRLRENKPTDWHVIRQIGENKLGPWGRLLVGMITAGESPYGEKPQSNLGVGLSIAGQVAPAPISLGKGFRALGHLISPGHVAPNPPGVGERQFFSAIGIKMEPGRSYAQKISKRAHEFMTENGFEYRPYVLSPTEDASYDKIRTALRSGDEAGALKLLRRMQQVRTDRQITTSFRRWAHAPLSGNRRLEQMFVASLDDAGLDDYSNAVRERIEAYQKFIELYAKNPREAKAQPGTR